MRIIPGAYLPSDNNSDDLPECLIARSPGIEDGVVGAGFAATGRTRRISKADLPGWTPYPESRPMSRIVD